MASPDLYRVLDELGPSQIDGVFYRHTGPNRDPLSGFGASQMGGRWNPPGIETVYLARPLETCRAEFHRMATGQGSGAESFLPRMVYTIAITRLVVANLTIGGALAAVGLSSEALVGPFEPCQRVGDAASTLGFGGVLAPSASGSGEVLAVFSRNAHHGELYVVRSASVEDGQWHHLE